MHFVTSEDLPHITNILVLYTAADI